MKVVFTHAYSSHNSGDGLLVDESLALVREAFPAARASLLAWDPASFADRNEFEEIVHPILGPSAEVTNPAIMARWFRHGWGSSPLHDRADLILRQADLVVGVGGGYLRGGSLIELAKTLVAHGTQMKAAGTTTAPVVMLPQSIGPFPMPLRHLVERRLSAVSMVWLRDDISLRELDLPRASRAPDLALLSMPSQSTKDRVIPNPQSQIGIVARKLGGRSGDYNSAIVHLIDQLGAEALVQSSARGNDDVAFYRALGLRIDHPRSLRSAVVGPDRPGVVVSVRLHGALESVRMGVPAIHLSYERKGWGAYDDLGVPEYCHSAKSFDPEVVVAQANALRHDPSSYWQSVDTSMAALSSHRHKIVDDLQFIARGKL